MPDKREQFLAEDVVVALKSYLGTDSFPSDQWPAVARSFAALVEATGRIGCPVIAGHDDPELRVEAVQDFLKAQSDFHSAIVKIVE